MNDMDLVNSLIKEVNVSPLLSSTTHTSTQFRGDISSDRAIVLSEIPITAGQLHKIAAGNYCMVGSKGEPFAVRFLLKSSFKLNQKDFIVRNIVMQIIAVGKENTMRKEDIATDVKLIKKEDKRKVQMEKPELYIDKSQEELF